MAKYKLNLNLSDGTSVTTSNTIDIPSISANPSSTTATLTGLTIDGTDYAVAASGKSFTNVSASSWVSSSTYSDYSYQCALSCSGITADSFVEVVFAPAEATSGNYAPVCLAGTNTVTIYSKVNTSITVKTVKEIK